MKVWKKKESLRKKKPGEEINALLGLGTEFEGKLTFEGAVRVDGKFTGEVRSNGILIVGDKGVVRGDIQAGVVLVRGEMHGTIRAKSRMEAYSPARIFGDLYAPVLVFGEGVVFQGTSHMTLEDGKMKITESSTPELQEKLI